MIIVLLNDDVNPIKCKGCISTMKQYKCKLVNRGVNNFKHSKILHMFYKEGNRSSMWAGLQHEDKENECVVCLRPVSLKALLCLNALQRCERVAALFVFNHRSRNEQRKQTRCTMGAGRSSLPLSHRFFGRKPQGKPRVCPPSFITSTLTRYGCSALWPIHKSGHAWMRAYTYTRIHTYTHVYTHIHSLRSCSCFLRCIL